MHVEEVHQKLRILAASPDSQSSQISQAFSGFLTVKLCFLLLIAMALQDHISIGHWKGWSSPGALVGTFEGGQYCPGGPATWKQRVSSRLAS